MFDELSARFEDAVKSLRGEASINENNIEQALKDVRRALLEADVSLPVAKEFVEEVREKSSCALSKDETITNGIAVRKSFIVVFIYSSLLKDSNLTHSGLMLTTVTSIDVSPPIGHE